MEPQQQLELCLEALRHIRQNYGHVCHNFELCSHTACMDSYSAWATADIALQNIAGTWKDTLHEDRH